MSSTTYPPHTTPEQLNHLLTTLKDYALSHGLTVRPPPTFAENKNGALTTHAPVSLFPSLFPREAWQAARNVQTSYNAVYAAIASDDEWLGKVSQELAVVDEFIGGLYQVHKTVAEEGFAHEFSLGLFRSDYMLHQPNPAKPAVVHQVEFNTIASSFGALASRVSELHRHLLKSGAYPSTPELALENIPLNPAVSGLAAGLAAAHNAYVPKGEVAAILFLVQADERNAFDQRWLEYELLDTHAIKTYRISLADVLSLTRLDPTTRALLYSPPHTPDKEVEISTVYFRAGYGPEDYPTPSSWAARTQLERSRAIKCPTIATQLAGSKKVQQLLADPQVLERFTTTTTTSPAPIRETFAAIYPLDESPRGLEARKLAFEHPERYVLKPQREGGGNNVYREKIPGFLKEVGESRWRGYILMEMIETPADVEGVVVRGGECVRGGVVGELGVYGTVLWRVGKGNGEVVRNEEAGWLLRTKGKESEEGGVAAGFGCVDGVCLV